MIPDAISQWRTIANSYRDALECDLILAVIWQESSGNQWAYRYEPAYQYFYDPAGKKALYQKNMSVSDNRVLATKILGHTELNQQSASWGLMQVMGAVARERGFVGFVSRLCNPNDGIRVGASFLNHLYRACGGDLRKTLVRYNGGGDYPDKIFDKLKAVKDG